MILGCRALPLCFKQDTESQHVRPPSPALVQGHRSITVHRRSRLFRQRVWTFTIQGLHAMRRNLKCC